MFKNSLQIVGLMYAKLNHTTEDTAFVSHKVDLNKQNSTPEPPSHITGFEVRGPPSPEPANGEPTANCSSHFRHEMVKHFYSARHLSTVSYHAKEGRHERSDEDIVS